MSGPWEEFAPSDPSGPWNEFAKAPKRQMPPMPPEATTSGEFAGALGETLRETVRLPLQAIGYGASKAYNAPIDLADMALQAIGRTGIPTHVPVARITPEGITQEMVPGASLPFDISNPSTWRAQTGTTLPVIRAARQAAGIQNVGGTEREPLPSAVAQVGQGVIYGMGTPEGAALTATGATIPGRIALAGIGAEQMVEGAQGTWRPDASLDERLGSIAQFLLGGTVGAHMMKPNVAPPVEPVRPEITPNLSYSDITSIEGYPYDPTGYRAPVSRQIPEVGLPLPEGPINILEEGEGKTVRQMPEQAGGYDLLAQQYPLEQAPVELSPSLVNQALGVGREKVPLSAAEQTIFEKTWEQKVAEALEAEKRNSLLRQQSSSIQGRVNIASTVSPNELSNLVKGNSLPPQSYSTLDAPSRMLVIQRMRSLIDNDQIAGSVISAIPVDVMNQLGFKEPTTQNLFHNKTMLLNALTVDSRPDVISSIMEAIKRSTTIPVAEELSAPGNLGSSSQYLPFAGKASNFTGTEVGPKISGSKIHTPEQYNIAKEYASKISSNQENIPEQGILGEGGAEPRGSHLQFLPSQESSGTPLRQEAQGQKVADIETYNNLVAAFKSAPLEKKFDIQRKIEAIKNKYGGMPPKLEEGGVSGKLYTNPFFDPEVIRQTGREIKEGIYKLGTAVGKEAKHELSKLYDRTVLEELNLDTRTAVPDLPERTKLTKIASRPFAADRVPVLGRILGGLARVKGVMDESLARWAHEKHGIGPAITSAMGEQIRGKIDRAFDVSPRGDILNIRPTRPGLSVKVGDVFEELQRNPRSYELSPYQRQVFEKTMLPILNRRTFLIEKYDLVDTLESYFPRTVTKMPEAVAKALRASRAGKTQMFQFEREFPSEKMGWDKGVEYERSIEKRLIQSAAQLYDAIADKRLATDPNLAGFESRRIVEEFKTLYADDIRSGRKTERQVEKMAKEHLETLAPVHSPAFAGRVFEPEVAERLNKELLITNPSTLRQSVAEFNRLSKAVTLGFDLGVGQLQLLPMAYAHPKIWGTAIFDSIKAIGSRQVLANYVRNNLQPVRELAQMGSSVGKLQDFMEGFGESHVLSKIPVAGPVAEALGRQYQVALDVAKVELWKAYREVTPRNEWPTVVKTIESWLGTSRMESAMVHPTQALTERTALLASSYYRGALNFVASTLESGVSRKIAIKGLAAFMLGGVATFYGIAKYMGMSDEEIKRRMDPTQSDFLMWRVKVGDHQVNIGIGGIYRSLLRLSGNIYKTGKDSPENLYRYWSSEKNPLARWYRGHAGPLPSGIWDIAEGKDFLGREAGIESMAKKGIPLIFQDVVRPPSEFPKSAVEYGGDIFGLSSFPDMRREGRELDVKKELYPGKEELTLVQRAKVTKLVEERKPKLAKTPESVTKAATATIAAEQKRADELQKRLAPSQQEWMAKYGLRIPGYSHSIPVGSQRVHLTKEEGERFDAALTQHYGDTIKFLQASKAFNNTKQEKARAEMFSRALQEARQQAIADVYREIKQKTKR